jgi:protein-S-isoprenylcysteine O-methyltransferase Ste14
MTESPPERSIDRPRRIILPPVWLLLTIGAMVAAHRYLPLQRLPGLVPDLAGLLLILLGVVMAFTSVRRFSRAETGIVPFHEATAMVTGGFYRFTRNPMYLGMVLVLLGIALKMGSLGAFLPIPLFALVIHFRYVLPEERFLEEAFGDDYLAFKARVRRWL